MTPQEAISVLKKFVEINERIEVPIVIKAVKKAIEALEKQIPKKPVYIKEHNVIYFDWQCRCCKREYVNSIHGIAHCVDCGQPIDWSEEE